jgi:hypothetical protein
MLLQGHVNTTAKNETAVKGAIWQVLPVFESLMSAFEDARQRHKPTETLASQRSEQASTQATASSSPPTTPSPEPLRITRSSQSIPITRISAPTFRPTTPIAPVIDQEQSTAEDRTLSASALESQKHFSTNINLAWQKLDKYYQKTDASPIYRAAVVLHPRLKWRWFDRYWKHKPQWRRDAKEAVAALWAEYKHAPLYADEHNDQLSSPTTIHDEWSVPEEEHSDNVDQFKAYLDELWAQVHPEQSPIPYWISKRTVWPELAKMALDIYSTPACSDSPERVFSDGGDLLQ